MYTTQFIYTTQHRLPTEFIFGNYSTHKNITKFFVVAAAALLSPISFSSSIFTHFPNLHIFLLRDLICRVQKTIIFHPSHSEETENSELFFSMNLKVFFLIIFTCTRIPLKYRIGNNFNNIFEFTIYLINIF